MFYVFIQFMNENIIGIFQILFEADPSQVIPIIKLLTSLLRNECRIIFRLLLANFSVDL